MGVITSAKLDALRTTLSLAFEKAYDTTQPWAPELATEIPSSTETNTYGWLAQSVLLREWVGKRVAVNLSEHDYTIKNRDFEGTVEIDRNKIEDDNLGIYTAVIIPQLGQATKKHADQLIRLTVQANPKAFDGKLLFAADHPTFDKAGSVYANDFDLDLDPDGFNFVWSAMVSYTGEDGQPLTVMPNKLVIPPQLKKKALEVVKNPNIVKIIQNVAKDNNVAAASVANVMEGWAEPLILPELAGQPLVWYLADTTKPLKPFIYQKRRAPQFVSQVDPQAQKVFDQKTFSFGVDYRGEVGVSLPFLLARSTIPG